MCCLYPVDIFRYQILQERTQGDFIFFNSLLTPGLFLSITIGTSDFLGKFLLLTNRPGFSFKIASSKNHQLFAASSMSMAGLLMQTITQNQFVKSEYSWNDSRQTGNGVEPLVFPSASLTQKMLLALAHPFYSLFFLAFYDYFFCKGKVDVALIGIIYGIIGSITEVIAYRFNSIRAWRPGPRAFSRFRPISMRALLRPHHPDSRLEIIPNLHQSLGDFFTPYLKSWPSSSGANDKCHHDRVPLPFLGVIVPNRFASYGDNLSRETKLSSHWSEPIWFWLCDILSSLDSALWAVCQSPTRNHRQPVFILLLWRGGRSKANIPSFLLPSLFWSSELVSSTFGLSLTRLPCPGSYVLKDCRLSQPSRLEFRPLVFKPDGKSLPDA